MFFFKLIQKTENTQFNKQLPCKIVDLDYIFNNLKILLFFYIL